MEWMKEVEKLEASLKRMEQDLFTHPELGFKEFETRRILGDFFAQEGLRFSEDYGLSGFRITIGSGTPHIGLIAELDALVTPGHPACGSDGAAHSCGHHLQSTVLAHVLKLVKEHPESFPGTVSLFLIAAEEYVDLDYRRSLQAKGELRLLSGKQNLILQEAFKDVDVILSLHTMGETKRPMMEVNAGLSGFIYKRLTFKGTAAHAAVAPHLGVNALNALVLTQNAIALLRETFQEKDMVRVHLMTTLGGQTVNSVPSETVLEGYVRSITMETLRTVNERINTAATHCALALGAQVEIQDNPGYLPLVQCRELSDVFLPFIHDCVKDTIVDHQKSFAAGDLGDVSMFKPVIQLGVSGCAGIVHGKDFRMVNATEALIYPAYVLISGIETLLNDPQKVHSIVQACLPKMTLEEYRAYHQL